MQTWYQALFSVLVGLLAAGVAATSVPPLVAFLIGLAFVPFVAWLMPTGGAPDEADPPARPAAAQDHLPALPGLIDALPSPLMIVSDAGRIVHANRAAHAALPRIAPGAHFAHIIRAPAFVEAIGATLADGIERTPDFTAYHGGERFFEARVARLRPPGNAREGALAIVQVEDRTDAHRSEQLRSDFIANASHELRTPLASVIGYIETLQNHAREDDEAREKFLAIMAREAGRMQRMVDDLMSLSRIEMSEHVPPVEECSLNRIATESAAALQPLARQQDVTIRIDLPPTGARVIGDRDQLYQVFTNLIDNGVKYGGKTVSVAAAEPSAAHPNRHGVTVADDGPGIDRPHVHRLTERFYRVNVGHSRNKGGTGLGLAIVKHILNRHRGRLEIASTAGEGSRFTVWMPPAAGERTEALPLPEAGADRRAG